jgi:hypothetical protein
MEIIKIDDIEYVKNKDSNECCEDPITFEKILFKNAIMINDIVYDMNSIFKWIKSQHKEVKLDIYRRPIDANIYKHLFLDDYRYKYEYRLFNSKVMYGDILLLKNNKYVYAAGYYSANIKYYFIFGYNLNNTNKYKRIPVNTILDNIKSFDEIPDNYTILVE